MSEVIWSLLRVIVVVSLGEMRSDPSSAPSDKIKLSVQYNLLGYMF